MPTNELTDQFYRELHQTQQRHGHLSERLQRALGAAVEEAHTAFNEGQIRSFYITGVEMLATTPQYPSFTVCALERFVAYYRPHRRQL